MRKLLICLRVCMVYLNVFLMCFQSLFLADAIAPALSKQIFLKEAELIEPFEHALHQGWVWRAFLSCLPWLFVLMCAFWKKDAK